VFAARGEGPFQLVYGSRTAKPAALPIQSLIPGFGTSAEMKASSAQVGEQTVSGPPPSPPPMVEIKTAVLWPGFDSL